MLVKKTFCSCKNTLHYYVYHIKPFLSNSLAVSEFNAYQACLLRPLKLLGDYRKYAIVLTSMGGSIEYLSINNI